MKHTQRLIQLALLAALILGLGAPVVAQGEQEQQIKRKDVPAAVLAAFAKAYPNAKIKGYSKEPETENGQAVYEIECAEGKTTRDVTYAADGTLVLIEETLDTSELPPGVKAALDNKFPDGKIRKAERVTKGTDVRYEFKIKHNGQTTEIVFDPEGNELEREAKKGDAG